MRILSYRGPCAPGGVSNSLAQIFNEHEAVSEWWFLRERDLVCVKDDNEKPSYSLHAELVSNHYRYCNNFLWPVLHDMPELAIYSEEEQKAYQAFNAVVSFRLRVAQKISSDDCFVNDYQFALIPELTRKAMDSFVFWHIPWPKNIWMEHSAPLCEIAAGLLAARVIGFHIQEYLDNFVDFVIRNLPQLDIRRTVYGISIKDGPSSRRVISLVCAPLGIDSFHWNGMAKQDAELYEMGLGNTPFILSVDRCDYTKGVFERLNAIDYFFSINPEWKEKVVFVQIGARSRPGLPVFDQYWESCRRRFAQLNSNHATEQWNPLIWIESPQSSASLAKLYSRAQSMIVSPIRDGLNLTAKEYVASQHSFPGTLVLSKGAGVYKEIGKHCIEIETSDVSQFSNAISQSLTMSEAERYRRIHLLKSAVICNSLSSWWQSYLRLCGDSKLELTDKRAAGL
ncbi:MAG: trehalose-6-phosphate synthase [Candidatus Obscuribacterales bacterium]|nr:trehalose-6-phosphate synthase [Candidatus Obscuribacterales bacterium]